MLALVLVVVVVVPTAAEAELVSVVLSLLDSVAGGTSDVDAVGLSPVLLLPLVSRRSIIRDTDAIPALTSLLTSEPRSATDELREKSLSFHPRVLFVIDSLYLCHTKVLQSFRIKIHYARRLKAKKYIDKITNYPYFIETAFKRDFRESEKD